MFEMSGTGGSIVRPCVVKGLGNETIVIVQPCEMPQSIQGGMEDPKGDIVGGARLKHVANVSGVAQYFQYTIVDRL